MDKYNEIKNIINEKYIDLEGIELSEEIISLYDLIQALENGVVDLKNARDAHDLRTQINKDRTVVKKVGLFKQKKVLNQKCTSIISEFNQQKSRITFSFEDRNTRDTLNPVIVVKDRDCDELYFEYEYFGNKEFVQRYMSEIYEMFATFEKYADCFPVNEKCEMDNILQVFDDGFLSVIVAMKPSGKIEYTIEPSKSVDRDIVKNIEWLDRVKLGSYVRDNSVAILDNIPVDVSSLNVVFRNIVQENLLNDKSKILFKGM